MAYFRGDHGYVALGGQTNGSVFVQGATSAGATSIDLYGNGSTFMGAVAVGDTFTIAGESGLPVHTVTGGPFYLSDGAGHIADVQFTPGIATGGVLNNAIVTITSNAVAQVTQWSLQTTAEMIETTVMGAGGFKTYTGGLVSWTGASTCRLDYSDPRQAALIDKIMTNTPNVTVAALTFGVANDASPQLRQFFGAALLKDLSISGQLGQVFSVSFNFQGTGTVSAQWIVT